MSPLYKLLDWLNDYRPGEKNNPLINDTNIEEFDILNKTVEKSINRQEELFEHQREFIGNASHEIQTPLAICKNRLEILTEDENLTEQSLEQIARIQQSLEYIIKLNRSLLFLTKIENRQFTESHTIDVDNLVDNLISDYSEIFEHKALAINKVFNKTITIEANDVLINSLIGNVLRNAFIHSNAGGKLDITIADKYLSVSNSAADGELNEETIFERFSNNNKKEGSTGLGLAIVKAICDYYGYSIKYEYKHGNHIFKIFFA